MGSRSLAVVVVLLGANSAHAGAGVPMLGARLTIKVPGGWHHEVVTDRVSGAFPRTHDELTKEGATIAFRIADEPPLNVVRDGQSQRSDDTTADPQPLQIGATTGFFQRSRRADGATHEAWAASTCAGTIAITVDITSAASSDTATEAHAVLASVRVAAEVADPFVTTPDGDAVFHALDRSARALVTQIVDAYCHGRSLHETAFPARGVAINSDDLTPRAELVSAIQRAHGLAAYAGGSGGVWTITAVYRGKQVFVVIGTYTVMDASFLLEKVAGRWQIVGMISMKRAT